MSWTDCHSYSLVALISQNFLLLPPLQVVCPQEAALPRANMYELKAKQFFYWHCSDSGLLLAIYLFGFGF